MLVLNNFEKRVTRVKIDIMNLSFRGCHEDDKKMYRSRNWKYDGACDEILFGEGGEKQTISCPLTIYVNIYRCIFVFYQCIYKYTYRNKVLTNKSFKKQNQAFLIILLQISGHVPVQSQD